MLTKEQERIFKQKEDLLDLMERLRESQLKSLEKMSKIPDTPFTYISRVVSKLVAKFK